MIGLRAGLNSENLNQYDHSVPSNPVQRFYIRVGPSIHSSYVASWVEKFGAKSLGRLEKSGKVFKGLNSHLVFLYITTCSVAL